MASSPPPMRFLSAALQKNVHDTVPVWAMRQAGRYLPEYREYTQGSDFFHNCQTPERAKTITLQPLRLGIDAIILFSDILVIPQALGMEVEMSPQKGPQFLAPLTEVGNLAPLLGPLESTLAKDLAGGAEPSADHQGRAAKMLEESMQLKYSPETQAGKQVVSRLTYTNEALKLVRSEIEGKVPLIGFVGAPWTLMCYMTEGGGKTSYAQTRRWMFECPDKARQLLHLITNACLEFLLMQIENGAQVIQVFESHGGEITPPLFADFELPCLNLIASTIRKLHPEVPVILFARNCLHSLERIFAESEFNAISVDCHTNLKYACSLGKKHGKAVQGNLDPCCLYSTKEEIKEATHAMLREAAEGMGTIAGGIPPSYIANLGWGMLPTHSPDHLQAFIDAVHSYGK